MSTGPKKENRGGARPGAGRKPLSLSAQQIKDMREAAEKRAKKEGKTLFEVLLDWIYDAELGIKDRQNAMKLYMDKMLIAVSEGGEADKELGPAVYLPGQRPQLEAVKAEETKAA